MIRSLKDFKSNEDENSPDGDRFERFDSERKNFLEAINVSAIPENDKSTWIYHEKQESKLCGQHCLNNLMQGIYFTIGALADFASEIDKVEKNLGSKSGYKSENIDETGNFNIEVLKMALKNKHNIDLFNINNKEIRNQNLMSHKAFIINHSDHFFTVRKIGCLWWILDSLRPLPVPVAGPYLNQVFDLFIKGGEKCSIFVAQGNIPDKGHHIDGDPNWYKIQDILNIDFKPYSNSNQSSTAKKFEAFSGSGRKLTNDNNSDNKTSNNKNNNVNMNYESMTEDEMLQAAIQASLNDNSKSHKVHSEDDEIAKAIAMSLQETPKTNSSLPSSSSSIDPKEQMRLKRLEAMQQRGWK